MSGDGDGWVNCTCGRRHWGLNGAAGLLIIKEDSVLLQHRSPTSHNGDTWGLPGGARDSHEDAIEAALREAHEEAGVEPRMVEVLSIEKEDHGNWAYDTVIAIALPGITAYAANHESLEIRWVRFDQVAGLNLHPSFAKAWPKFLVSIAKSLALRAKSDNVTDLASE